MRQAAQWTSALGLVVPLGAGVGLGAHGTQQEIGAGPVSQLLLLFSAETASPHAEQVAMGQHESDHGSPRTCMKYVCRYIISQKIIKYKKLHQYSVLEIYLYV